MGSQAQPEAHRGPDIPRGRGDMAWVGAVEGVDVQRAAPQPHAIGELEVHLAAMRRLAQESFPIGHRLAGVAVGDG